MLFDEVFSKGLQISREQIRAMDNIDRLIDLVGHQLGLAESTPSRQRIVVERLAAYELDVGLLSLQSASDLDVLGKSAPHPICTRARNAYAQFVPFDLNRPFHEGADTSWERAMAVIQEAGIEPPQRYHVTVADFRTICALVEKSPDVL